MKKTLNLKATFRFCLCLLILCTGCDFQIGGGSRARYKKTVQHQSPLESGSIIKVGTSSGSIKINGADVSGCEVIAEISVMAPTELEAQEIAEQVDIIFEKSDRTLTIRADKPRVGNNRSISISYEITVPKQTVVDCKSSYGSIRLSNINESVSSKTSSGSIDAENIEGAVDLDTSYGSVTCRNISGGDVKIRTSSGQIKLLEASFDNCDLNTSYGSITAGQCKGDVVKLHSGSGSLNMKDASIGIAQLSTSYGHITCREIITEDITAKSSSGGINITCSDSMPSEFAANVVTSYGSIDFVTPPGFSGEVEMGTSYGLVSTDLPITITGQISKKKLTGKIGQGNGKLYLKTSSGSIRLK